VVRGVAFIKRETFLWQNKKIPIK